MTRTPQDIAEARRVFEAARTRYLVSDAVALCAVAELALSEVERLTAEIAKKDAVIAGLVENERLQLDRDAAIGMLSQEHGGVDEEPECLVCAALHVLKGELPCAPTDGK
jgi:hypothetical protein